MISVSQLFGFTSMVTVFASMQFKNIKLVLLLQVLCNASGAACYIIDGHISACSLYAVAIVQSLIFLGYRLFKKEAPKYFTWIFAALFLLCSVVTFKTAVDIISTLAAITCALALAQKNSTVYRFLMVTNGVLWLAYDIVTATYEMVPAHILTAAAAIIGIVRLDIMRRRQNSKGSDGSKTNNANT